MGVFLTAEANEPRWSKSTVGAIWLCYLLGFKEIYLLGVDHSSDYQAKRGTAIANRGYGLLYDQLKDMGVRLANVGTMSAVESLETFDLDEVLSQAEEEKSRKRGPIINDFQVKMFKEDGAFALNMEIDIDGTRYGGNARAPGQSNTDFCRAFGAILKIVAKRVDEDSGFDLWTGRPTESEGD